ncbi:EF-hand domain-containing protein [Cavenderia fasciculata]|uniref:EF-hand domain-containing protein n=1 Tax=Cavenderia fasciculata TaxID=261658 RepID=F4Q4C0_CACFS|nr:EF-hand domain-containing protein [Cavenderia fasciculata]EGG16982.1 EF-hand domain-containing protein [Cavenderia fasciculata]|eukprot:XP_004355464.1 EF-hand domain-containing protein [Cavenderia fasciculata]
MNQMNNNNNMNMNMMMMGGNGGQMMMMDPNNMGMMNQMMPNRMGGAQMMMNNNNNNMGMMNGQQQQFQQQIPQQQQQQFNNNQQMMYNNNNNNMNMNMMNGYQQPQQISQQHGNNNKPINQQQQQSGNSNSFYNNSDMLQGFPSKLPSPNQQQPQQISQQQQQISINGQIPPISNESKAQYSNVFFKIGATNEYSKVPGTVVKEIFQRSGVSNDILAKIWILADIDNDAHLDREEFIIGMHLVYGAKSGYPLPDVLPKYLVPESKIVYHQTSATNQADWQSFPQISIPITNNNNGNNNNINNMGMMNNGFQQQPTTYNLQVQGNQMVQMPNGSVQQQQQQQQFFSMNPQDFVGTHYNGKHGGVGSAISFEQRLALSSDLDAALAKRANRS